MKKLFLSAASLLLMTTGLKSFAQDAATAPPPQEVAPEASKPKLTFKPAGRILFDGALFAPNKNGFSDGVALPDIRLGGTATYGKFSAKLDIGYGMSKLSLKDVYIGFKPNEYNSFKLGYFVHQFGLNAATSSSMKPTMIAPTSDTFFNATGRNLGLGYLYDKGQFFLGASLFASSQSLSLTPGQQGKISVGAMERFVWRPIRSDGNVVQIGISTWYQSAEHLDDNDTPGEVHTSPGFFNFSANFPTKVNNVSMLQATVTNAKAVFKMSPELILAKDRFALEGQYYFMNVDRKNGLHSYNAHGGYASLRALILGDSKYGYSHGDAGLATPSPKTLECVIGYDITDAYDRKASIAGGISNDYSVTFNYYLNKYIICRLRYNYTTDRLASFAPNRHVNMIQARVMFKF